jgi:hypothetical protein
MGNPSESLAGTKLEEPYTLFLSVLPGMSLRCLISMHSGVKLVASRCVCLVAAFFVMFGRLVPAAYAWCSDAFL